MTKRLAAWALMAYVVLALGGCALGHPVSFGSQVVSNNNNGTGGNGNTGGNTGFGNQNLNGTVTVSAFGRGATGTFETVSGTVAFNGNGSITTPNLSFTDKNGTNIVLTFQTGTYQINADGTFLATLQFSGGGLVNWSGSLNAGHDVAAYTYQRKTNGAITAQGLGMLSAPSTNIFSNGNLSNTLGYAFFGGDAGGNFFVDRGTINTNSNGNITGGTGTDDVRGLQTFGATTYTVSTTGALAAQYLLTDVGFDTANVAGTGTLAGGQDTVLQNATDNFPNQGVQQSGLMPLVNLGTAHTNTDFSGTFGLQQAQIDGTTGGGTTSQGTITFDGLGNITGGQFTNTDLNGNATTTTITGGTYLLQSTGHFAATIVTGAQSIAVEGFDNLRNNLAFAFFDSGNGNHGILTLTH